MFSKWRKNRIRRAALKRRVSAHGLDPDAGKALVDHFPDELWPRLHSIVAGYRPVRDEIDPTPLMETFFCEQVRLCLPVVVDGQSPLKFKAWTPGEPLFEGPYGVQHPDHEAKEVQPGLILVPLVSFDPAGHRLGYGGGYYDRTLAAFRAQGDVIAVGLAYEAQKVRSIPTERHDQSLDWVITEARAYKRGAR